jgi:hypothetical protein
VSLKFILFKVIPAHTPSGGSVKNLTFMECSRERDHKEDQDIGGWITLKWTF